MKIAITVTALLALAANATNDGKHLFILAGQSNMARLDPTADFQPLAEKAIHLVQKTEAAQ